MDCEYECFTTDSNGNMKLIRIPKTEELCEMITEKFKRADEDITRLREENRKLKSEVWKDEEMARLKKENEELRKENNLGFPITQKEMDKIHQWMRDQEALHPVNSGAIGGRYEFRFHPTSIGVIGEVIDSFTKEKLTFQDL